MLLMLACVPVLVSTDLENENLPWEAPDNSWPLSIPPEDLVAEGFETGQVVPDFRLPDQYNDTVSLWQFYGLVVVLDISTMWCAPCRILAEGAQEMADEFRAQGFIYLTVFPEDADGDAIDPIIPDQEDLQEWSEYFELDEPLLSDGVGYSEEPVGESYPVVVVIDRSMRSTGRMEGPLEETIRAVVEENL
jgi:thiol-disulfide isomerase/thioredoxin